MYALLLPSAHSFISAVEENVKVDVRQIGVPTGAPTPCRGGSPPWMAIVWVPRLCGFDLEASIFFIATPFWTHISTRQAPIWRQLAFQQRCRDKRSRDTSGITAELSFLISSLAVRRFMCVDYFLRELVWHIVVVGKLHGIRRPSLRFRNKVVGVTQHFRKRDLCFDDHIVAPCFASRDAPAPRA